LDKGKGVEGNKSERRKFQILEDVEGINDRRVEEKGIER